MHTSHIKAVFLRQLFIIRNLPSRVVPYFLWAILDIVLWGFLTKYLNVVGNPGFNIVTTLLGAMVLWGFLLRVQQGMTIPFLEDVWSRNLLNMFASPLTLSEYIFGFVVTATTTSVFGLVVMLIVARFAFGLSMLTLGAMLAPSLLILFLFGIVLGIIGAGLVLRFGPYAEWFTWPIPTVLSPFVGVFYPTSVLPQWMQYISYMLPPSYVFEGMRSVIIKGIFVPGPLLLAVCLTILYLAAAYGFFALMYRTVVRKGLITRFSAEGE